MSEEQIEEVISITPSDVMSSIVEGAELYSEITESFIKDFVFY